MRHVQQIAIREFNNFNPRTSYEVRLENIQRKEKQFEISIHAPLTRCDLSELVNKAEATDFNPRTSYEVRQRGEEEANKALAFQSTHLLRGATRTGEIFLSG